MNALRNLFLPIALGLAIIPTARAGDDDKAGSDKKEQEKTVRGVVSEVTILGETDVDFSTGKAVRAEATYLTVIGHPAMKEGEEQQGDRKEGEANQASNPQNPGRGKRRMNVYVLAISPKTKVCECMESGKGNSAATQTKECEFDKMEIGDRVEISYEPKMNKSEKEGTSAKDGQKHGRHRIYFGSASDIKILDEAEDNVQSNQSEKKDSK